MSAGTTSCDVLADHSGRSSLAGTGAELVSQDRPHSRLQVLLPLPPVSQLPRLPSWVLLRNSNVKSRCDLFLLQQSISFSVFCLIFIFVFF